MKSKRAKQFNCNYAIKDQSRTEREKEREEKNKQNDMKSNEIGTIPIEHTTCGLLLLFWSESDQKEQRVVLPDVVSLVHQMPNALQDIKILYDRYFALFLPSSLHCFFLSFWQPDHGVNRLVFSEAGNVRNVQQFCNWVTAAVK